MLSTRVIVGEFEFKFLSHFVYIARSLHDLKKRGIGATAVPS